MWQIYLWISGHINNDINYYFTNKHFFLIYIMKIFFYIVKKYDSNTFCNILNVEKYVIKKLKRTVSFSTLVNRNKCCFVTFFAQWMRQTGHNGKNYHFSCNNLYNFFFNFVSHSTLWKHRSFLSTLFSYAYKKRHVMYIITKKLKCIKCKCWMFFVEFVVCKIDPVLL